MLECAILTIENEIEAIAGEWRRLHAEQGTSPFSDYDWFHTWWRLVGSTHKRQTLHVVVGRRNGALAAVLPLTVTSRLGIRMLRAAGQTAFYYCDMVCKDKADAAMLWQAAAASPHYDFADIRDVYPESMCAEALLSFARKRDVGEAFYLRFPVRTSAEWMASLSGNVRGNFKRCTRRIEEKGALSYHVYEAGPLPAAPLDDLVKHKTAWSIARDKPGLFHHPDVGAYFHEMAKISARQGRLFFAWLQCGDKAIAFQFGLVHRNVLHLPFWTHDDAFAQFSPGNVIMVNTICRAIDQGLQSIDLRQGKSAFKVKYANETRDCTEFTFSASPKGRLLEEAFIAVRSLQRRLERHDDEKDNG